MIRLSRLADYAVVVMTDIARSDEPIHSGAELAATLILPAPTVSKVLKLLARGGLLESRRGVKGGYTLARSADAISIADIVGAVEGPIALTDCAEHAGHECDRVAFCQTQYNWQIINNAVREALERITLSEMCSPLPAFQLDIARRSPCLPRQKVT